MRWSRFLFGFAAAAALCGAAHASPAQDYMLYCMGCHGAQAEGVPGKIPPLTQLGLYMRTAAGRDYVLRVPGAANSVLSDVQLTAVLNWLAHEYDSKELAADVPLFTVAEVAARRHSALAAVQATRREVVRDLAATGPAPPANY
jgi:mono/diheme cytochrome c family protein